MKVIIAGSRGNRDAASILDAVNESGWREQITEVVCGMAAGSDTLGRLWAEANNIHVEPFPVTQDDYNRHGRYEAPKVRNTRMARYADALILIWDGKSGGSRDMLEKAQARNLKIYQKIIKMRKFYRVFKLNFACELEEIFESWEQNFKTREEAEQAIIEYGTWSVNYTILEIFKKG